jgi:UDP-N-acetylglucosamine/UDP-N-acetylgalactosamine diphosphorylase
MMNSDIKEKLVKYGQEHLLSFMDELSSDQQAILLAQLENIDFEELEELIEEYVLQKPEAKIPEDITPAPYFSETPENSDQEELYRNAERKGRELLGSGKVAALTVAGGQGSRLGFDGPKGSYPVTPVKNKTLFQYFSESLKRAGEKFGAPIKWYIMTSTVNDQATRDFFEENNYFGLAQSQLFFFKQGTMPAIGIDGKLLLKEKNSLALAPNGHGGTLLALYSSGALDDMKQNDIEYISYFQVDNPLVSVVNPFFIGLHDLQESEISARALIKTGPLEKLGNFCMVEDRLEIIEYSDMPDELAKKTDSDGRLTFRAGSPAIHVLSRKFVERLTAGGRLQLPWHRADKKVPCITPDGERVDPESPNGVKLETFIFDAIPMAGKTMILEAQREHEFAPVKNQTGVDSAESCRAMLIDRDVEWLEAAGIEIPRKSDGTPDCKIELSPATFFDLEDVKEIYSGEKPIIEPGQTVYYE